MPKFPSTLLPVSSDPTEISKAMLDLLDKVNRVQEQIPAVPGWQPNYVENVMNNVDPTDTNWHALDLSGYVPAGSTSVKVRVQCLSATIGHRLQLSNSSIGAELWLACWIITGGAVNEVQGEVRLDSKRNIYYRASNAGISGVYLTLLEYLTTGVPS